LSVKSGAGFPTSGAVENANAATLSNAINAMLASLVNFIVITLLPLLTV